MEYTTFLLLLLLTLSSHFIPNNNHIICHAMNHPLPISTPTFGGCYNADSQTITSCTFGPPCPSNNTDNTTLTYLPPNILTLLLLYSTITTTTNLCHNPITIPIGRCAAPKDYERCSPFESNCQRPIDFIPPPDTNPQCGITTEWTSKGSSLGGGGGDMTKGVNTKGSASEYPRCGTEIQPLPPISQNSEDGGGGGIVFNNDPNNNIDPEDRHRRMRAVENDNYATATDYQEQQRELQGADDDAASNQIKTRCVLNQDDCIVGDEEFLTIRESPFEDPCFCHRVPVGLCHLIIEEEDGGGVGNGTMSQISADRSFCAVGEYDCPPLYKWMSAYELDNMKNPPRICRLCHNIQRVESLFYERVVDSGGCYFSLEEVESGETNLVFQRCALERTDCQESRGEIFLDGRNMRERGHVPCPAEEITGGSCKATIASTNSTELTTTVEICTNSAASCQTPEEFVPMDSCTIHQDLDAEDATATTTPAVFGSCTFIVDEEAEESPSGSRCVWHKDDCNSDFEVYNPVQPSAGIRCQCEDVQTGGCLHAGGGGTDDYYTCAVSSLGCTDPSTYIPSYKLRQVGIDCRLCHSHRPIIRVFPSPRPSAQPSVASVEPSGQPSLSQSPSGAPVVPIVLRESRYMVYSGIGGIFVVVTLCIILFRGVVGGSDRADLKLLKTLKKLKKKPTHTTHTN